ncbi:MAG: NfeD family protein [Bacteroidales bacterium]|nr:NfeD family protein [Bacteroidales bacterium]
MTWTVIAVLILVGFLFLLLEILVLPGINIAGVLGFLMIGIGVWQAYEVYGGTAGHYTLGGTVILTVLTLAFALKSKTWDKAMLHRAIDSKVNLVEEDRVKVGDTGRTVSRLAPAGKALINGDYFEVRTNGEFIDHETDVVVVNIDHNKITVKPLNPTL